jgi:hypothetical protein
LVGGSSTAGLHEQMIAAYGTIPAVGRHYYAWLEHATGASATFYGDNGTATLEQAGIYGSWVN